MDLHLEIITPEDILYAGPVGLIEVPGTNGMFTLLKNHAPIISTLKKGRIRVIGKDGNEMFFPANSGVVECKDNLVSILLDKS